MRAYRSIIIPAFNEEERLGATLEKTASYLRRGSGSDESCEVIVVCDGCADGTEDIARGFADKLPLRLISYAQNRGKGYAVRRGVAASSGRLVAFMDADGATPVEEIGPLSAPILGGEADIVIGSRRVPGASVAVRQPPLRRVLGRSFSCLSQALLGLRVQDTQCGFKVFDGTVARDLFRRLSCDGFAFDLEVLAEAGERGLRVVEKGVHWNEVPGSTVHPFRDGLRMARALLRIRGRLSARRRQACGSASGDATAVVSLYGGNVP